MRADLRILCEPAASKLRNLMYPAAFRRSLRGTANPQRNCNGVAVVNVREKWRGVGGRGKVSRARANTRLCRIFDVSPLYLSPVTRRSSDTNSAHLLIDFLQRSPTYPFPSLLFVSLFLGTDTHTQHIINNRFKTYLIKNSKLFPNKKLNY